jgi:penicillin-binding protein 1A
MAAAYASFANDGVYNSPRLYTKVADADGQTVLVNETETATWP